MTTIHAVIWCDFIPLSLPVESAKEAIDEAKAMLAKSATNGVALHGLRAVTLHPDDTLETLWSPEQ